MFPALLASVLLLQVGGVAVMMLGARRATEGYEDEAGFHQGREPVVAIVVRDHFLRRG